MKTESTDYYARIFVFIFTVVFGLIALMVIVSAASASMTPEQLQVRVDRATKVLVKIDATGNDAVLGSGLLLDSGEILTAGHLFLGGTAVRIKIHKGKVFRAKRMPVKRFIMGELDVALVTGRPAIGHIPIRCSYPKVNESVVVIGYPGRIGPLVMRGSVASADISLSKGTYILSGLEVAQGISGAPVFDAKGQLMGVVVNLVEFEVGGLAGFVALADIKILCGVFND